MTNQYAAAIIQAGEDKKRQLYQEAIEAIARHTQTDVASAEEAFRNALSCIDGARDFIEDCSHILGNMKTKHGEVAEMFEVKIGNAHDYMAGVAPRWNINKDEIGRMGPVDYIFDGIPVQSKFCNGANKSLEAILGHLDTYPDFGDKGFYQIPKDQYATIQKIMHGDGTEGLGSKAVNAMKAKLDDIASRTGKPIDEIIRPARYSYDDVQLGKAGEVLNSEEGAVRAMHKEKLEQIHKDANKQVKESKKLTAPSLEEALKYSLISGVIGGAAEAGTCIYEKVKSGKKISDFTSADWKDAGVDFGKGGLKGAASGMGIYWLTKIANCNSSIASAMASATLGIASLAYDYNKGKITKDEFTGGVYGLSYETSVVAMGAIVGQAIIPVPVLGAMLGSTICKVAHGMAKNFFEGQENAIIKEMEERYNDADRQAQKEFSEYADSLNAFYKELDWLICSAEENDCYALMCSIMLCRKLGIDPLTLDTIDDYMKS